MKFTVAPSILSANFSNLSDEIRKIGTIPDSWVHLDIMDGHFVPNITFGPCVVLSLRKTSNLFLDVHLMVDNPENFISVFEESGADALTFHIESTYFPLRLIKKIREAGLKVGVSLNPATNIERVFPILRFVDILLIMSVEPGFSGQKFLPFSIEKIQEAKKFKRTNNLNFLISVDGGVNSETAEKVLDAGADILVMGSFFFKTKLEEIREFIEYLRKK